MTKLKRNTAILYFWGGMTFYFIVQFIWVYLKRIPDWETYFVLSPHPVWVPFAGSVVGGSLTLIGVLWTLRHSQKKHSEDVRLRVMPQLILEEEPNNDSTGGYNDNHYKIEMTANSFHLGYAADENATIDGKLPPTKISNLGFGPAYIYDQTIFFMGNEYDTVLNLFNNTYLPHNSDMLFRFDVTVPFPLLEGHSMGSLGVVFYYTDINKNEYRQRIDIDYNYFSEEIQFENIYTYHQPELLNTPKY